MPEPHMQWYRKNGRFPCALAAEIGCCHNIRHACMKVSSRSDIPFLYNHMLETSGLETLMLSPSDTAYPLLREDMGSQELQSCYLPSTEELKFSEDETRSGQMKFAFLLMLKTFQRLGYFVSTRSIPERIVSFISGILEITVTPDVLGEYDLSRNRNLHQQKILKYLGVHDYACGGDSIVARAARQTALVRESLSDIINACIETLLRERFELPAFSRIFREAVHQRSRVYEEIFDRTWERLGEEGRVSLDQLFQINPATRRSLWDQVKFEIGSPRPREISKLLKHIEWLKGWERFEKILLGIPPSRLEQLAIEACSMDVDSIQNIRIEKRYTLAIVFVIHQKSKSIDSILSVFLKQMTFIFHAAKSELEKYVRENQDRTDEILRRFVSVNDIISDESISTGKMERITEIMKKSVDLTEYARTHCEFGGKQHLRFMARFFKRRRSLIFRIFRALEFQSSTQDESLIRAIEFLMSHRKGRSPVLETSVRRRKNGKPQGLIFDLSWVENRWWRLVTGQKSRDFFPSEILRKHFEVCLCDALAHALRCGDIFVSGSLEFNDYRRELLPLSECEQTLAAYGNLIGFPVEQALFISHVRTLLAKQASDTDIKYPENPDFSVRNGTFHLRRLQARTATQRNEGDDIFADRLSEVNLINALADTAHWLSWHTVFGPHSGFKAKIKDEISRYVAMVFAYGTGLGPVEGAKMIAGLSASQLADTDLKHSSCDKIERAIFTAVSAYNRLHLPRAAWGKGKSVAADGTHWNLSEHNAFAERHIRYGQWGGIAYYHVADNYIAVFSKFIPCGIFEAVHILDGVFSQAAENRPQMLHGDTHAQNTVVFGLSFLLGIRLMPRIRAWQELKFYKPDPDQTFSNIEELFTKEHINWDLISRHLPDMLQVAQSIMAGTIKPSTILRRLGTVNQRSRLYQAFNNLGRVIRTVALLEYVSDRELRHLVQGATGKCEQFNKFAKWLHFAQDFIKKNRRDDQQRIIKYNHLIAVLLTFHNAYSMTEALVDMEKEGTAIPADVVSMLSPYRTRHVRRFGEFKLPDEVSRSLDFNLRPAVTDMLETLKMP